MALFKKVLLKEQHFLFLTTGIGCRDTITFLCLLLLLKDTRFASTLYCYQHIKFMHTEGAFSTFPVLFVAVDVYSDILSLTS